MQVSGRIGGLLGLSDYWFNVHFRLTSDLNCFIICFKKCLGTALWEVSRCSAGITFVVYLGALLIFLLYYTISKIKRELKHVYVYFRIFSHYTTLYAAYAKPISTFEELLNVNLAPYENCVLTNDIIEGGARARGRDMYAGGARGARIY